MPPAARAVLPREMLEIVGGPEVAEVYVVRDPRAAEQVLGPPADDEELHPVAGEKATIDSSRVRADSSGMGAARQCVGGGGVAASQPLKRGQAEQLRG